ncbi:MAG TPA: sensor histidine kinase [Mycobacteriales bacterium]|nr:sensor histidine kinase [Mycobacteriales bacterium]
MGRPAVFERVERAAARAGSTAPDLALAVGATLLVAGDLEYTGVHPALGYGVALPALLSLAWRRRAPVVVAIIVCATNLMLSLAATNLYGAQTASIAVILAVYTVASRCDRRLAAMGGAVTLPLVVAAHAATEEGDLGDFLGPLLWVAAWTAGRVVRRRTLEAARIATDATLRAQLREDEAREAVSRERDRIARELHDVVAHAVSLVVVQAGAERLALGATAPRTRGVLDAIETAGRQALVELRAMLAVLRTDGEAGLELGPQPDLDALPALVERVREAGLPVDVDVDLPAPLPAGVGLSTYRIVQEALTNALKHSPTSATVTVRSTPGEVVVEVRNPGAGASTGSSNGSGRGLVGMRERAALHAGELTAGPEGHDWVVRARLPLTPAAAVTG